MLGTALFAFTITSYLLLAVSVWLWFTFLRRHGFEIDWSLAIAATLIVFGLGPTYMNAVFGQVNVFVLVSAVAFVSFAPTAAGVAAVITSGQGPIPSSDTGWDESQLHGLMTRFAAASSSRSGRSSVR